MLLREMALWQCMTFEKVGKRWEKQWSNPTHMGYMSPSNWEVVGKIHPLKIGVAFLVGGGGAWLVSLTKIPFDAF